MAKALNRMRERITALIDDRTKMLAAISHDLRTPITRMRLRSEFIDDEVHRSRMLRDLDQMRSMLESVLSFLRNDRKLESMTLVDIATTLQLVTDQFADMGHKVVYDGPEHAMATVRPDDLHRSVTNLVENAVRFGAEATIRLTASPDTMTIEVEDDGPGISDARKEMMLEPFVRGDDARNMDEAAGFGLGLSIARSIVLAHGGELSLQRPAAAWTDRAHPARRFASRAGSRPPERGRPAPISGRERFRLRRRRNTPPPRTGSRRPSNARDRRCGSGRFRSSPGSRSACRIGRRGFREANSRNRFGPWRISLLYIVCILKCKSDRLAA